MPMNADVKVLGAAVAYANDTAANWTASNPVLPVGLPGYEIDTGKLKIGDGTKTWTELDYKIDAVLTPAQKTLLDKAGQANGVIVAGADGRILSSQLPSYFGGSVQYVANIAARDALTADRRNHALIMVADATGDPTVTLGAAQYFWSDDLGQYVKIAEQESMDVSLAPYFNVGVDTLARITDGGGFVKMTDQERVDLATLKTDAVRYTDSVFVPGVSAAQLLTMTTIQSGPIGAMP